MRICTETRPKTTPQSVLAALHETGENYPDVEPSTPLGNLPEHWRLAATLLTGKKWSNGRVLRVSFIGGHPEVQRRVRETAEKWKEYANIDFEWLDAPQTGEIRIAFNPDDGSWSYLGTDALTISVSEPTMNFGWLTPDTEDAEYHRVVQHEFGHLLGMPHEHQNPAGGIPWNRDAVYKYYSGPPNYWDDATIQSNIFERYDENLTVHTEVDKQSIMMYAISPDLLLDPSYAVGWNTEISEKDKSFISWQYPKEQQPPQPTDPYAGLPRVAISKLKAKDLSKELVVTHDHEDAAHLEPIGE